MKKAGIELIAAERQEQIHKHSRTILHDVLQNKGEQLSIAASKLCCSVPDLPDYTEPDGWDFDLWDKMISKPYKDRLIIAGALIAAEIDRLQYLEQEKAK